MSFTIIDTGMTHSNYKLAVFIFFSSIILFDGCYSYAPLMEEGKSTRIDSDEDAIFSFTDGSRLKTDSYHHIYVDTSADIIIGTGARYKGMTKLKDFSGQVDLSNVDSTGTLVIWGDTCFVCYLKNGTYIKFKEEDYVKIREGDKPGLWCVGKLDSLGEDHLYKGRLPEKGVREIEAKRVSQIKTGLLILLIGAPAVFSILVLTGPGPGG